MADDTKLSAFILLDRSGSMSGARWENAIDTLSVKDKMANSA